MKKVLVVLLSLALIVGSIAACGQNAQTPEASPEATPTVEPTVEPTAEPTVEPTAEPTPEPTENADQGEVAPLSQGDREDANGVTLYGVFQDVYDSQAILRESLAEIGITSTTEEDVQAEIDAIPGMAEAYNLTLPDDYIQQYLDWRPGGIGNYGQEQSPQPDTGTKPSAGDQGGSTGNTPSTGGNTGGSGGESTGGGSTGGGSTGGGSSGNYGYDEYVDNSTMPPGPGPTGIGPDQTEDPSIWDEDGWVLPEGVQGFY